jgi:hypothetical protein
MRLIGIVVGAVLGLAVVAEGAYIVRTRSQLAAVSQRLESLTAAREGAGAAPGRSFADSGDSGLGGDDGDEPVRPRRLPPPRLVTPEGGAAPAPRTDDPLPLPPAIDSPQGREQLRQFVLAQLERERQEARVRQEERRQQRDQERRDRVAKELGLSAPETEKFNQILNDAQAQRARLRDQIEAGDLPPDGMRQAMMAARQDSQQKLRGLLGDERMKKLETLGGAGGGGPFGDGRRGGPGGGRWGGPGGGPPGGSGIPPGAGP